MAETQMTHPRAVPSPSTDAAAEPGAPYRWRWLALSVVLAAEVMDLLDATIISLAAPSIRADLGGGSAAIQWFAAGYTLAFAVGLITGGRLGDIFGRKRMFVIGAVGFTLSSLLCGLAPSPEMLIGLRVLQGAFGAVMIPQGLGIIKAIFPPKEMAAAFGAFGPVMGLAAVCGPILAGVLIDADLFGTGWRMIFLINLPLGLLALAGAARFLPESRSPHAPRLDLVGMGLITVALLLLVYPLVQGRVLGWPAWAFASLAAALPVFALFAWYEVRRNRAGGSPLIVPGLFAKRAFSGGLVVGMVFFAGVAGFMLVFAVFMQAGLGYSPLRAGLTMVPWSLGTAIGAGLAGGLLAPRFGRRVLHAGAAIMAAGVVTVYAVLELSGTGITSWQFAPALLVTGVGMGLLLAPFFDIVLAGVEPHEVGSASGTLTATQQLGNAVGVAVLGTIFFTVLGDRAQASIDAVGAMRHVLWVEVGLLALTFALAFLLPRHARPPEQAEADEPRKTPAP